MQLLFGIFSKRWNGGFDLSAETVRRIQVLGAGVGFDIYADLEMGKPKKLVHGDSGVDSFFAVGGNPNVGIQVVIPPSAQIKAGGNLNGITMEWMTLSIKPDQFLKLAKAAKLEFRIGTTSLPLTD